MNEKNENAIKGFETISPLTHGMSFVAQKGLISRVEQNCLEKRLISRKQWIRNKEENKPLLTIVGFGDIVFDTVDFLLYSKHGGKVVRLNDERNRKLSDAQEICKTNGHLVDEYYEQNTERKKDSVNHILSTQGVWGCDCDEAWGCDCEVAQIDTDVFGFDIRKNPAKAIRLIKEAKLNDRNQTGKGLT